MNGNNEIPILKRDGVKESSRREIETKRSQIYIMQIHIKQKYKYDEPQETWRIWKGNRRR